MVSVQVSPSSLTAQSVGQLGDVAAVGVDGDRRVVHQLVQGVGLGQQRRCLDSGYRASRRCRCGRCRRSGCCSAARRPPDLTAVPTAAGPAGRQHQAQPGATTRSLTETSCASNLPSRTDGGAAAESPPRVRPPQGRGSAEHGTAHGNGSTIRAPLGGIRSSAFQTGGILRGRCGILGAACHQPPAAPSSMRRRSSSRSASPPTASALVYALRRVRRRPLRVAPVARPWTGGRARRLTSGAVRDGPRHLAGRRPGCLRPDAGRRRTRPRPRSGSCRSTAASRGS